MPDLGYNLLFISVLEKRNFEINFSTNKVSILRKGTLVTRGIRRRNLYYLTNIMIYLVLILTEEIEFSEISRPPYEGEAPPVSEVFGKILTPTLDDYRLAYIRWGHLGRRRIKTLLKHIYSFITVKKPDGFFCDTYKNNKAIRRIKRYRYDRKVTPGGRLFFNI